MARKIKIPSKEELRPGARRSFVDELFERYRDAHRPSLRQISDATKGLGPGSVHVSPETIRRMLNGTTVPGHWPIVGGSADCPMPSGRYGARPSGLRRHRVHGRRANIRGKAGVCLASRPGLPR